MKSVRLYLFSFLFLLFGFMTFPATAHYAAMMYIEAREVQDGVFDVQWQTPFSVRPSNIPMVEGAGCVHQVSFKEREVFDGVQRSGVLDCPDGITSLRVEYPRGVPIVPTLWRLTYLNGQEQTAMFSSGSLVWNVPPEQSWLDVAAAYTELGIEHIWLGIDHLLFLMCLVLIAKTSKRILVTVTGFTLSHSVTLVMAALGVVDVPIAPVEACIALSIVFLAVEIARASLAKGGVRFSLTWRYPVLVSTSFGFLHGFGFASVLGDIGLPEYAIVNALLFFNVGVEIGQVVFVLVIMALFSMLARIHYDIRKPSIERGIAYGVGVIASYWLVERIASFVL